MVRMRSGVRFSARARTDPAGDVPPLSRPCLHRMPNANETISFIKGARLVFGPRATGVQPCQTFGADVVAGTALPTTSYFVLAPSSS